MERACHVLAKNFSIKLTKIVKSLVARVALFEPHERFMNKENQKAREALFSFEKGIVPVTIATTVDEVLPIYKDATLGSSQLVTDRLIHEVNQKQMKDSNTVDTSYDLENVRKAFIEEMNNNCRADFRNLIDEYSDTFFNQSMGTRKM